MEYLDTSSNRRLPVLMRTMQSLGTIARADELLERFTAGMREAYGANCFLLLSTVGLPPGQFRVTRLLTIEGVDHVEVRDFFDNTSCIHQGGLIGEIVSAGEPKVIHDVDLSNEPVYGAVLAPYHSLLAAPILSAGTISGWAIRLDRLEDSFSMIDIEELLMRVNLIGALMERLQTSQALAAAHKQLDREIESIAQIQRSLLPDSMPKIPGLNVAASYATFDQAGGDFYNFIPLDPGADCSDLQARSDRWAILIGDVSGHGPAAAVVMAMVQAILHAYPRTPHGPAELLTHLNRQLCHKRIEASFVTAFLAFYDARTRQLTYARAGHNPPILRAFPKGSPVHLDEVGDLPLGIDPDVEYEQTSLALHVGETLILYTDGITEALKPGGDMFGMEGIEHSLHTCTGSPDCAINHITQALLDYQKGLRPKDDQTVVALQVIEPVKLNDLASGRFVASATGA